MRVMTTWKLAVVLAMAAAVPASGTTIVAVADDNSVAVAADSVRGYHDRAESRSVCKLHSFCGRFAAAAGFVPEPDEFQAFADSALCSADSLRAAGLAIVERMRPYALSALRALDRRPASATVMLEADRAFEVLVGGIEDGRGHVVKFIVAYSRGNDWASRDLLATEIQEPRRNGASREQGIIGAVTEIAARASWREETL